MVTWHDDVAGELCEPYMQMWMAYQQGVYSNINVKITGSVGPAGVPAIAELRASDPDDRDLVYGEGDELEVVFGIATDRSNATQRGTYSGDRLFVDSLFAFNAQLGQDYSGAWRDDSIFVVTIKDPMHTTPAAMSVLPLPLEFPCTIPLWFSLVKFSLWGSN